MGICGSTTPPSIPTPAVSKNNLTCQICLDEFSNEITKDATMNCVRCGMRFHYTCMNQWEIELCQSPPTCPNCRNRVRFEYVCYLDPVFLFPLSHPLLITDGDIGSPVSSPSSVNDYMDEFGDLEMRAYDSSEN